MIDFWELAGRLMLMDQATRQAKIYADDGLLPLQADGCILLGHAKKTTLPFSADKFYDPLRKFFIGDAGVYRNQMLAPVVSMYALGEVGVMFFNQRYRTRFDALSTFLRTASIIKDREHTGSNPIFYIALTVIAMDTNVRKTAAATADFQGLPVFEPDRSLLQKLAADTDFQKAADLWCFGDPPTPPPPDDPDAPWTEGSQDPLNIQTYPATRIDGRPDPRPYRHVRFLNLP